jgi:hypothetical protein
LRLSPIAFAVMLRVDGLHMRPVRVRRVSVAQSAAGVACVVSNSVGWEGVADVSTIVSEQRVRWEGDLGAIVWAASTRVVVELDCVDSGRFGSSVALPAGEVGVVVWGACDARKVPTLLTRVDSDCVDGGRVHTAVALAAGEVGVVVLGACDTGEVPALSVRVEPDCVDEGRVSSAVTLASGDVEGVVSGACDTSKARVVSTRVESDCVEWGRVGSGLTTAAVVESDCVDGGRVGSAVTLAMEEAMGL